ncbi:GntR family transcriptional regulator [Nesterenkonia halobia]|uniref:GntR family transcriptional regulator n=1 Tax=Nesterenkonia halobia TaxID=37922 RepID=A0ABP6RIT4_9MICC
MSQVTQPLQRQILRDHVYEVVLEMLLDEQLVPGAALSIDRLSRQLGVSPTPVREALAHLEHTGLISRSALKGYRVTSPLSSRQMASMIEARSVVELAAVELAMQDADTLKPQLQAAHERHHAEASELAATGTAVPSGHVRRAYFQADQEFHQVFLATAGNEFLGRMLDSIGAHQHRMLQSVGRGVTDHEIAVTEHARILSAVEQGDVEAAVHAMRCHLDGVKERAISDSEDSQLPQT